MLTIMKMNRKVVNRLTFSEEMTTIKLKNLDIIRSICRKVRICLIFENNTEKTDKISNVIICDTNFKEEVRC